MDFGLQAADHRPQHIVGHGVQGSPVVGNQMDGRHGGGGGENHHGACQPQQLPGGFQPLQGQIDHRREEKQTDVHFHIPAVIPEGHQLLYPLGQSQGFMQDKVADGEGNGAGEEISD